MDLRDAIASGDLRQPTIFAGNVRNYLKFSDPTCFQLMGASCVTIVEILQAALLTIKMHFMSRASAVSTTLVQSAVLGNKRALGRF